MQQLINAIPDLNILISISTEELAIRLLPFLAEREQQSNGAIHGGNLCNELRNIVNNGSPYAPRGQYTTANIKQVLQAFVEAWSWLEVQGLIVPLPDQNGNNGFRTLSRRARRLVDVGDFKEYLASKLLPRELLHPAIHEEVWMAFVRGNYDAAVLYAMKQVEVAVRNAGAYGSSVIGTDLMRQAFHPDTGPLTDKSSVKAEREARQHLFAGAIGSYKNPQSHRHVNLEDPHEAIEQVMLASHLLRIVASRVEFLNTQKAKP